MNLLSWGRREYPSSKCKVGFHHHRVIASQHILKGEKKGELFELEIRTKTRKGEDSRGRNLVLLLKEI